MRLLILPDIHTQWELAEQIIQKYKNDYDSVICLGDEMDAFDDTIESNQKTAEWLKFSLAQPNRKHLMANHTMHYRFPELHGYRCSGFTLEKCLAINEIMKKEDWEKMPLCHFQDGFLFTHAGICLECFGRAMEDTIDVEHVQDVCESAILSAQWGKHSMQLMAGRSRGGQQMRGGATWLDWTEFKPIKGLNQCVGHTVGEVPRCKTGENSINWNLDTHLKYFGFLEDGSFKYQTLDS